MVAENDGMIVTDRIMLRVALMQYGVRFCLVLLYFAPWLFESCFRPI